MHADSFLELRKHHSPGVHGQRYKNQLQDIFEEPVEAVKKQINRIDQKNRKCCFFSVVTPDCAVVLPLQR